MTSSSKPVWFFILASSALLAPLACGSDGGSSGSSGGGAGTAGTAGTAGLGGGSSGSGGGGAGGGGAGGADAASGGSAGADAAADAATSCDEKAKPCVSQFGALFTKSNGRADGKLVALVRPVDQSCAGPNSTHVVLELSILGQVQRLVVSVDGVLTTTHDAPLLGPAWSEGWHEGQNLEYATDLGVHSTDFTSMSQDEAVAFVCSHLELGDEVSVYAYSDGTKPSSAHQIHSNDKYPDGAVVVHPKSALPTWLLFRYPDQVF